jgi:hypothetical protein
MTLDSNGKQVKAGDFITSAYGIPPKAIRGEVFRKNGRLRVLTPGHNPAECSLATFKKCLGDFWKEEIG